MRDPDAPPPPIVRRTASELPPEELQAECTRYAIPAGDTAARLHALQHKYDEEFEAAKREYDEYIRRQEMKKVKEDYEQAVHDMKALEQLALARDAKTTALVQQIQANVAPRQLVVRGLSLLGCCALLRSMRENTNVVTIDLSNNHLDDIVAESVGKMLLKNKRLRGLNLGNNLLTARALTPLGNALQHNTVLTSLSLESNPILANHSPPPTSPTGMQSPANLTMFEPFFNAISSNSTLTSLNVFNTQMTLDVGRALARAFESNTSIIAFELGGNSIKQTDLMTITSRLAENQSCDATSQAKTSKIRQDIKHSAEEIQAEQLQQAKERANVEWHEANARERAKQREHEEWERARIKAEEDVRVMIEIEAQQKKYMEQRMEEKNPKGAKGKK